MGKPYKTKYYVISDTHFNHANIINWCQRKEGYEEIIMKNLRNLLTDNSILIHLGDIAWKTEDYWVTRFTSELKGKKYLVKGNHDKRSYSWYLERGFDFVCDSFSMNMFGTHILFSHKPMLCDAYDINIHGHFHNVDKVKHEPELREIMCNKHELIKCEYDYTAYNVQKIVEQHKRMG